MSKPKIYPTLYTNAAGKVARGPDLEALHWTEALNDLAKVVEAGELPENARIVGEYWESPDTVEED